MRVHLRVLGLVASVGISASALAQGIVERGAQIDWNAVRADMESGAAAQHDALRSFRAANTGNLDAINVPVLVPGIGPVRAAPEIKGQKTAYAAVYSLPAATLSVQGSSVSLVPPNPETFAAASGSSAGRVFDRNDDGADLSFTRYGAAYVLSLSCARPDDERCTNQAFLNGVADSLIPIGGKE
ncbi:hypothetical protein ACVIW2_000040 [Bradyrhizobium huanghuaihaiense]